MADEIHELAVAIRPETGDTEDELESVQETFTETAEQTEDSAEAMDKFSSRFRGAMNTIVGGLSVAAVGLLSTVPVIGEAASGLFAILESIGLKVDQILRPVLGPLSDAFFNFAAAIDETEGPLATLIGVLGTVVGILGTVVAPLIAIAAKIWGLSTVLGALSGAFTTVVSAIGTVVGALASLISLPALVIAAIVALAAAFIFNVGGIRDKTVAFVSDIIAAFVDLAGQAVSLIATFTTGLFDAFSGGLFAVLNLIETWIATVRTSYETLFAVIIASAKQWANSLLSIVEGAINRAVNAIPDEIRGELGINQASIGRFESESMGSITARAGQRLQRRRQAADHRQQDRTARARNAFADRQQTIIDVQLDGKTIAEAVSSEQEGEVSKRGRGGR